MVHLGPPAYLARRIVGIDYDSGASEVNRLKRIKVMISVAEESFYQNGAFNLEETKRKAGVRQGMPRLGNKCLCGTLLGSGEVPIC